MYSNFFQRSYFPPSNDSKPNFYNRHKELKPFAKSFKSPPKVTRQKIALQNWMSPPYSSSDTTVSPYDSSRSVSPFSLNTTIRSVQDAIDYLADTKNHIMRLPISDRFVARQSIFNFMRTNPYYFARLPKEAFYDLLPTIYFDSSKEGRPSFELSPSSYAQGIPTYSNPYSKTGFSAMFHQTFTSNVALKSFFRSFNKQYPLYTDHFKKIIKLYTSYSRSSKKLTTYINSQDEATRPILYNFLNKLKNLKEFGQGSYGRVRASKNNKNTVIKKFRLEPRTDRDQRSALDFLLSVWEEFESCENLQSKFDPQNQPPLVLPTGETTEERTPTFYVNINPDKNDQKHHMFMRYPKLIPSSLSLLHRQNFNHRLASLCNNCFEGIKYIHSNNKTYNDLKFENCLFDKNRELKLGDFGLALSEETVDEKWNSNIPGGTFKHPSLTPLKLFYEQKSRKEKINLLQKNDIWTMGLMFTLFLFSEEKNNISELIMKNKFTKLEIELEKKKKERSLCVELCQLLIGNSESTLETLPSLEIIDTIMDLVWHKYYHTGPLTIKKEPEELNTFIDFLISKNCFSLASYFIKQLDSDSFKELDHKKIVDSLFKVQNTGLLDENGDYRNDNNILNLALEVSRRSSCSIEKLTSSDNFSSLFHNLNSLTKLFIDLENAPPFNDKNTDLNNFLENLPHIFKNHEIDFDELISNYSNHLSEKCNGLSENQRLYINHIKSFNSL